MPGNALDNKIVEFNSEHEATLTRALLETPPKKIHGLDLRFFQKQNRKGQRAILYHRIVAIALIQTIKNGLKINESGYYTLPDLNIAKFLLDFEEIMKLRQEESEYGRVRMPFEGINQEKLFNHLIDLTKRYDRDLSAIWAESVINEELSIEEMKRITDSAYNDFSTAEDPQNLGYAEKQKLGTFVTAATTMTLVREQRGFWWRVRHPFLNSDEKAYYNQMMERFADLIKRGFPVSEMIAEHDKSLMKKIYKTAELSRQRKNMDETEKLQKEAQVKKEQERREISDVHEKLEPIATDQNVQKNITDDIVKALPRCRWEKSLQRNMISSIILGVMIKTAQQENERFDEIVSSGRSPEKQMIENVKQVFKQAYSNVPSLGYMDPSAQLVAAQVMTDVVLKYLSPAALDGKKYKEFVSGYVLKNAEIFADITGMDGTEPVFMEAKKSYEEMQPEQIAVNEANVIASVDVGEQVENLPNMEASKVLKN